MSKQAREFIRHPTDIPIEVSRATAPRMDQTCLSNISAGGLAFLQSQPFECGSLVQIRLPYTEPPLITECQVVWCKPRGKAYEIGVRFLTTSDSYKVRMVEQICHIEQYKRDMERQEGRKLSGEEAASEWIAKYAARFPSLH